VGENKKTYISILSNHHILLDGWSTGIILKEFFEAYNSLCSGNELILSKKNKFGEFIKHIQNQDRESQRRY